MATNTTNYNWTKPDYEDDADIKDLNDNFDGIDAQVKAIDDQVQLNKNNISLLTPKIVSTDITELAAESYADGTVSGYANSFAGLSAAWVVIRTYTLNSAGSRKIQIMEAHTGDRKTRFFNGAWGAWN